MTTAHTVWLALGSLFPAVAMAAACESLASLTLGDARITMAQTVPAGAFSPPAGQRGSSYRNLPEFCRVAATLTPTSDSDIQVEVWLPAAGWNRKFQAVGNGGWAGAISYSAMAVPGGHRNPKRKGGIDGVSNRDCTGRGGMRICSAGRV